jgi:hypothetical protein
VEEMLKEQEKQLQQQCLASSALLVREEKLIDQLKDAVKAAKKENRVLRVAIENEGNLLSSQRYPTATCVHADKNWLGMSSL